MKIRHKIALWVSGTGLVTSLVLVAVVFHEISEQAHESHDSELKAIAKTLITYFPFAKDTPNTRPAEALASLLRLYWVKVYDDDRRPVYENHALGITGLPFQTGGDDDNQYTVWVRMAAHSALAEEAESDTVPFRVLLVRFSSQGKSYWLQIAKPLEELEEENEELLLTLLFALLVSLGPLVIASYWVAGRIVRPIALINRLSGQINDQTLSQRIPLGQSRDELYELSNSLNQMFDRLQYSFDKQKQFLANASHDLKTPVSIMRLFVEEAIQRKDLSGAFKEQLAEQSNVLLRMERLVRTLLDLSVLSVKVKPEVQVFDLAVLLREVIGEFSMIHAANGIQLETVIPETLLWAGDKEMIRRLVINILDNAIKYNNEDRRIRLEVFIEPNWLQVSLFNTGPGIPKEDLERVFEQFYRVEQSRALRYGGSGLGLTIVKEIVRLHQGRVVMESEPGSWTRIRIFLPRHLEPIPSRQGVV